MVESDPQSREVPFEEEAEQTGVNPQELESENSDEPEADEEDEGVIANQLAGAQNMEAEEKRALEEGGNQDKPDPMSWFLFMPLFILCVIGDVIDFFTAGTIGWFVGLFIDGIVLLVIGFAGMGRKQFRRIVIGLAADSFPVIAIFPFRTIFLCWAFLKSRSEIVSKLDSGLVIAHNLKIDARNKAGLDRLNRTIERGKQPARITGAGTGPSAIDKPSSPVANKNRFDEENEQYQRVMSSKRPDGRQDELAVNLDKNLKAGMSWDEAHKEWEIERGNRNSPYYNPEVRKQEAEVRERRRQERNYYDNLQNEANENNAE